MEKKDFIWKMGGQQGQGVESCGEILGRVLAQEGYSLFSQRLFASRIKGGHTTIALRIATKEIATIGEHVDCLVALDQETIDLHGKEICEGGVIIADDALNRNGRHIRDVFSCRSPLRKWQRSTDPCR